MPISLTDDELLIVMSAARPLAPQDRDRFLRDVAGELEKYRSDIGPGLTARICRDAQRRHFNPPSFHLSKYDRGDFVR
jgi:hypothetical protein